MDAVLRKCRRAGLDGPSKQRSARRHSELQPLNSANSLAQETSYWFLANPLVFLARFFYKEARTGEGRRRRRIPQYPRLYTVSDTWCLGRRGATMSFNL